MEIEVGSTYICFKADRKGNLPCGVNLLFFTQRYLKQREWNPKLHCYVTLYTYSRYDRLEQKAYLPRYALDDLIRYLRDNGVDDIKLVTLEPVKSKDIELPIKKEFSPRDNQIPIIKFLSDKSKSFTPLSLQTGAGKFLVNSTPVRTPNGFTPIGDLKVNDLVLDQQGNPTKVIGVYPQGLKDIYRVYLKRNVYIDAGDEHLWRCGIIVDNKIYVDDIKTTLEIRDELRKGNKVYLPKFKQDINWIFKDQIVDIVKLDNKAECTCIKVDNEEGLFVVEHNVVTHNTFCAIRASCELKGPILIVLGSLIDQWMKSIEQFTNISRDDIYVIQGFDRLKTLWEMLDNGFQPKIVVIATRTLILYAVDPVLPYLALKPYKEFLKKVGFRTKIFDECHTNFFANTQIDLRTNLEHNIYLSATYKRSDYSGKKIFNLIYPEELRFGSQFSTKYTTVILARYSLFLVPTVIRKFKVEKGYLHAKYENYLRKHKKYYFKALMDDAILPMIRRYYLEKRKEGQRLLILCQTKVFVIDVAEYIQEALKDEKLDIRVFFSGESGAYGKEENKSADVIVSTMKSCSTGVDIKDLKTCICTVSYASEPLAEQTMGRLRQIPGEDTYFIDLWNYDIPSHYNHKMSRAMVYRSKALKVEEILLN